MDTVLTKDSTIYAHWKNTDGSSSMGGSGGSTGGPAAAVGGLKESLPKNHTGETEIINNVKVPSYVVEVIWKAMEGGRWRLGWVVIDGKYYYFHEKPNGTRGRMHPYTFTPDGYHVDEHGVWAPASNVPELLPPRAELLD